MTGMTEAAERLALVLTSNGMQRMTARVMAALLFADQETVTAGELAEWLVISPGTVSTALKALSSSGLVERVPAPGSRREHFRFRDEAWVQLMSAQNQSLNAVFEAADRGIKESGEDSIAGRRLVNMRDFYAYVMAEMPAIIERWRAR